MERKGIEEKILRRIAKCPISQIQKAKLEIVLRRCFSSIERFSRLLILSAVRLSRLPFNVINGSASRKPFAGINSLAKELGKTLTVGVVRFDGIGDHILTLPLINALYNHPAVKEVKFVLPPNLATLFTGNAHCEVEVVRPYSVHCPILGKGLIGHILTIGGFGQFLSWRSGRRFLGKFDLVLLPRWDADYALNARSWALGTGSIIVGHNPRLHDSNFGMESGEARLLNLLVESPDASLHEIQHLQVFMDAIGLDEKIEPGYGKEFFFGTRQAPTWGFKNYILAHPGAINANRCWPDEMWIELFKSLSEVSDLSVLVIGAPSESAQIETIISGLGKQFINCAGMLPMKQLPSVMAHATAFVGSDSGPMHIAACLKIPLVAISSHSREGSLSHVNSPTRFGPWGTDFFWVCPDSPIQPCNQGCESTAPHCITQIPASEVLSKLMKLLAQLNN